VEDVDVVVAREEMRESLLIATGGEKIGDENADAARRALSAARLSESLSVVCPSHGRSEMD